MVIRSVGIQLRSRLASRRPDRYIARKVRGEAPEEWMTTFENRKDAFENKFALDEELRFKATARRNKLLGLWAAAKLGKSGDEAESYAKSVVLSDFQEAGDGDVLRKIKADLDGAGQASSDAEIRRTMDELLTKAVGEIQAGR
jgi:hypothetical protein